MPLAAAENDRLETYGIGRLPIENIQDLSLQDVFGAIHLISFCSNYALVRGEGARKQRQIGIERVKAGGIDTKWTEITGNIMYVETGTEADRQTIREGLYEYLSQLETAHQNGEPITTEQWAEAAYLLYQSPLTKKGSDAVHRIYLMTLASRWMEPSPKMPGDIDWRAYTKGQSRFVDEVVAEQSDRRA